MTDTTDPVTVLLVDDQDLVRTGFRIILDTAPEIRVVGEASDGLEAVDLVRRLCPDVVVMDIEMPVLDGLEATRRILEQPPGGCPAVLVLTTFGRDDYVFRALQAGASGFLLKTATPEELIEAIAVVHRGDALLSPQLTRAVVARAVGDATATRVVVPSPALATLTEREREVLDRLASGASNAEIARRLFLGEATVKTHVSNVLGKLGLRDRTAAVVFAYENGVAVPGELPT
ncbi:response regulator transcription factor [Frigoribacterium sp. PhB24]|uniref:response regulator n=1 Tax=Frigoribacterium sp. PhB24 TaxID=2485204 RepID=UPI000F4833C5|nr:response regulator transcription factor [Frigoribacterium sp. PhB24]ROS54286.1 LuxR family two component transcriptional regulator [Frigoribacterium sp. PhB24]